MTKHIFALACLFILSATIAISKVSADHGWLGYHWARTSNPFTVKVGDNLTPAWDSYLTLAAADWSLSSVLDMIVTNGTANPKTCKPTSGMVQVCNSKYGNNGWLGIASIWASGSHITQGTVKMNDTYFNTTKYNKPEWKAFVMCQEIGHVFGLDHQDEDFYNTNLNTCMDYTNSPASNQHPNQHDYDMLEAIYAHLDSFNTSKQSVSSQTVSDVIDHDNPKSWGKSVKHSSDGRPSLFVRDLGHGKKVFTHVIWAE